MPQRAATLHGVLTAPSLLLLVVTVFLAMGSRAETTSVLPGVKEMILIPGGKVRIGSLPTDGKVGLQVGVDELPQWEAELLPFYIDRYEVTNRQYSAFLQASGRPLPRDQKDPDYFRWEGPAPPPGQENHPVMYVDWYDADAYCRWAGKRLPAEEEWEKAARGSDGRIWPWGNEFHAKQCNVDETKTSWTLPVGSLPEGASPYGVHDLCGNVFEWTSSWYGAYPGSTLKRNAFGEKYKVIRGGSWATPYEPWSRAASRGFSQPPTLKHRALGFRCAKDAE